MSASEIKSSLKTPVFLQITLEAENSWVTDLEVRACSEFTVVTD